jgi:hypothetical protein
MSAGRSVRSYLSTLTKRVRPFGSGRAESSTSARVVSHRFQSVPASQRAGTNGSITTFEAAGRLARSHSRALPRVSGRASTRST